MSVKTGVVRSLLTVPSSPAQIAQLYSPESTALCPIYITSTAAYKMEHSKSFHPGILKTQSTTFFAVAFPTIGRAIIQIFKNYLVRRPLPTR